MKWYSLFDYESKKYFLKYFERKSETLKCIIEDEINAHESCIDITENVNSLLSAFFTYWLDIKAKSNENQDEETKNYLSSGIKTKDSKHFIVNNTIVTLQVLTKSRIVPNIENNKNTEYKTNPLSDNLTEKSGNQVTPIANNYRSFQSEFDDVDTISNSTNRKSIERNTNKIERSASNFFNNSLRFVDEPATEYSQITVRHICGNQRWILKSFSGIPTDFIGEIDKKLPDHLSLVRHLYEIHSTKKISGSDKTIAFLNNFDKIKVKEDVNVSVVYVGDGSTNFTTILSNVYGSYRFNGFLKKLGTLCRINSQFSKVKNNNEQYFAKQTVDNTSILTYHISTLITHNDSDPENSLKKHVIGSNCIIVVFNESGKIYELGTINNKNECVAIEIVPQNSQYVLVNTIIKKDLLHIITPVKECLTDEKAAILIKNLSDRFNLCIKVMESLGNSRNCDDIFMGQAMERFKKIEKFKRLAIMREKD